MNFNRYYHLTWMLLACSQCPLLVFSQPSSSTNQNSNHGDGDDPTSTLEKALASAGICKEEISKVLNGLHYYNDVGNRHQLNQQQQHRYTSSDHQQHNKRHRSDILQAAVCFHSHNYITEAIYLYDFSRQRFPNFAFPLVNIALVHLKNGQPNKVIETLNAYFEEVGGLMGSPVQGQGQEGDVMIKDYDAHIIGSPCLPFAVHRMECVNALNFFGIAHVELYHYKEAKKYYERAIEIGNDVDLIVDVYQNLGSLFNIMGLFNDAADSFLKSFWLSSRLKHKHIHGQTSSNNDYMNTRIDPTPLIQRAMFIPSISSSLEESILFTKRFQKRITDLMKLIEYGGVGWEEDEKDDSVGDGSDGNDFSDLFRVQDAVSNMNDIKALPPLAGTFNYWERRIQSPHFYLHYYGYHDRLLQELVMKMYEKISHPSLVHLISIQNHRFPKIVSTEVAPLIPNTNLNFNVNLNHLPHDITPPQDENEKKRSRLRIVFISSHFGGNEPHGLLLIDVIRRLPSKLFECIAIGVGTKEPSRRFVDAVNGKFYGVGSNDRRARELLQSLKPDCLVFGEVLNEGFLFFLAQTRFAPLQVLVMGAPVTSGFSTIDYFISGDRLEHPFRTQMSGDMTDREHYTEQVVLFDGQAISFPFDEPHPQQNSVLAQGDAIKPISATGIINTSMNMDKNTTNYDYEYNIEYDKITGLPFMNNNGHVSNNGNNNGNDPIPIPIYLCFQNLFKIHPIFDGIIMKILHADPSGHVVLQAARDYEKTKIVLNRIQDTVVKQLCFNSDEDVNNTGRKGRSIIICKSAHDILSRIHFIPRVTSDVMKNIYEKSTVIIHPFPFGGSKTASDALKSGIPLVTYPQPYLRGRLASTFYTSMALHEVVYANNDTDVNDNKQDHTTVISASSCCVAVDISDYISKAIRLGRDVSYRKKVSFAIKQQNHRIFDDLQTSFEWARFLSRALGVVLDADTDDNTDQLSLAIEMNNYIPHKWQSDSFLQYEFIKAQQRWKQSKMEKMVLF